MARTATRLFSINILAPETIAQTLHFLAQSLVVAKLGFDHGNFEFAENRLGFSETDEQVFTLDSFMTAVYSLDSSDLAYRV